MKLLDKKMLEQIGKRMMANKQTIAVAESVTSGVLQYALSSITDAAKFYHGGITVYNIAQKFKHLQVEPIHAQEVNCVSQQVANEMALHVCGLFGSNWGIGVTGYASPVPESGKKIFAYYAIAHDGKIVAKAKLAGTEKDLDHIQFLYAAAILKKLNAMLAP